MAIHDIVEKYLGERQALKKKKADRTIADKIRKPTAPPTQKHSGEKGEKGYNRREKHKKKLV